MIVRGTLRLRAGGRDLEAEIPPAYLSLSGSVRIGELELWMNLEGRTLTLDVRSIGLGKLITRPRDVLDGAAELREIAEGLSELGYRVEVRVRGLKVLSVDPRT